MASYFDLKKKVTSGSATPSASSKGLSYFDLKNRVAPVVRNNRVLEEEKLKELRRQEAETKAANFRQEAVEATSPMNIFKGTLAGLNPFSKEGRSNIAQGVNNSVVQPVLHPIQTVKNVGGAVKDFATEKAQETAYDIVYQGRLDDENLKTIEGNNKKILSLHEAIRSAQDETEKARLKRQAETYLKINGLLTDEVGGDLAKKTDLQLAGQALGTALDLTPFLGVQSLGTKAGLKTLGKLGVKSATKSLAKKTGGKLLGKSIPQTGKALTKEAMAEGGMFGGLSGLSSELENKDATFGSVAKSTAIGTGAGIGLGGTLSKILSGLGKKAPVLKKAIDEGRVVEKEIEDIFEKDGIEGVEKIVEAQRKPAQLKQGELAPKIKEIEDQAGKLKVSQINEAKAKLEQGYSTDEIADGFINPVKPVEAPKLTSKPVKVETPIQIPKESPYQTDPLIQEANQKGGDNSFVISIKKPSDAIIEESTYKKGMKFPDLISKKIIPPEDIVIKGKDGKWYPKIAKSIEAKAVKQDNVKTSKIAKSIEQKKTESNFAKRLNKDLPEGYKLDEQYEVAKMNDEAIKASELIKKDKQKAMRIASGVEKSDELTQTATNIELGEIAKRDGDWSTVNQLFSVRREAGTRRGQEIAMEKMSVLLNPQEKFMKDVVKARLGKVKVTSKELAEASKEIVKKQKVVKESVKKATISKIKLSQAQKLLDTLTC